MAKQTQFKDFDQDGLEFLAKSLSLGATSSIYRITTRNRCFVFRAIRARSFPFYYGFS
jgi:hypothetical protein